MRYPRPALESKSEFAGKAICEPNEVAVVVLVIWSVARTEIFDHIPR